MKLSESLIEARKLIENPRHWTTQVSARDKNGYPVLVSTPDAVRFCALGACARVTLTSGEQGDISASLFYRMREALRASGRAQESIADFNDHATHEEVLALFDETIEDAKKAEEKKND